MTTNKQDIAVNSLINEPQKFLQSVYRFFSHSMITLKNTFLGFFSQSITPTPLKDPQTTVVVAEKMVKKQQTSVVPATISDLPIEILSHILNFEPNHRFGSVSKDWNVVNGWVAAYQITSSQDHYPNQTEFDLLGQAQQQEIDSLIANKEALLKNVLQSNLFRQRYEQLESALKYEGSLSTKLYRRQNAIAKFKVALDLLLEDQKEEFANFFREKAKVVTLIPSVASRKKYEELKKTFYFEGTTLEQVCQGQKTLNELNEAIILQGNQGLARRFSIVKKSSISYLSLDLSTMGLTRIPPTLFTREEFSTYWPNVIEFQILGNKITFLPDTMFEYFPRLEVLTAVHNLLVGLPQGIVKSKTLEEIYVSANNLINLPEGMEKMPSLKRLDITGNCLQFIDQDLIVKGTVLFCSTIKNFLNTQRSPSARTLAM